MSDTAESKLRLMLAVHVMDPRSEAAILNAADELAALRKRAEEAEADAQRYRWLRDTEEGGSWLEFESYQRADPDAFDAAIDAARKETP